MSPSRRPPGRWGLLQINTKLNNNYLFKRLSSVTNFSITAKADDQWQAQGKGVVEVKRASQSVVIWKEKGHWNKGLNNLDFSNIYRWTQLRSNEIQLEHLRYGEQEPVQLVKIIGQQEGVWQCLEPHYCGQDEYHLTLSIRENCLILNWQIKGPNKDQRSTISYG